MFGEENSKPSPRSMWRWRAAAFFSITFLAIVILTAWYLNSGIFRESVRQRVVAELERITGGRVELHSFRWDLSKLEFVADDLTIHGLEPPTAAPYAHLDRLTVRVKIFSVFKREFGLRYVAAEAPAVHILVNADGTTNLPQPKFRREGGATPVETLFSLAMDHFEVNHGTLDWNDESIPLDIVANNVSAQMGYVFAKKRYEGRISVGNSKTVMKQAHPLAAQAELRFSLGPDRIDITSLRWGTPSSRLEASGSVNHLFHPVGDLAYKASLDLAELGSTAGVAGVRSGRADMEGRAHGTAADWTSTGRVTVHNLRWQDASLNAGPATAGAQFVVTKQSLALRQLVAQIFGGSVQGSIAAKNWTTTQQRGSATLKLRGLDLGALAAAAPGLKLRLDRLSPASAVSGDVEMAWSGSPAKSAGTVQLTLAAPEKTPANKLPLQGSVAAKFDLGREAIEIAQATLATPQSKLNASGSLGTEQAQLRIHASSNNVAEFTPLLPQMPVELKGRVTFDGSISGRLSGLAYRGHLQAADIDTAMSLRKGQPAKPMHWDSATGDILYSPKLATVEHGVLERGATRLDVGGSTTLTNGAFDEQSRFSVKAQLRNGEAAELEQLAGYQYPVSGTVAADVSASGTTVNMQGRGDVVVTAGKAAGEAFKELRLQAHFAGDEIFADSLELRQNGARVTGNGWLQRRSRQFRFSASGHDFDLAHLEKLQSQKLTVAGMASFEASGSGTLDLPVIQARLEAQKLVLNGETVGDIHAQATTRGREMEITANTEYNGATLAAHGNVRMEGAFPGTMAIEFHHLDVDPALRAFLGTRVTGHSAADGKVDISGPLRDYRSLRVTGTVTAITVEIEKVRLQNQGPIQFSLDQQVFTLARFHVSGEGTDLQASGHVALAGDKALNLDVRGNANLKLLQGLNRDILSYGTAGMEMTVAGTLTKPALRGSVTITNAGISFIDLPNGMSGINGSLVFNENRLQIQTLTARTGGGTLDVAGFIAYRNGLFWDLTAKGKEIRLRYPPGISAAADADLKFSGTTQSSLLTGEVLVTRFGVNPRFDFALYLARSKQPPTMTSPDSVLANLRLDVHVVTTPELRVETSLAKISGDADLRIRGTASRPAVLGRVNIVEGDVFFNATRYRLERGDINFTNPVRIEPVLNIEASARVREYDITLGFHGSVDKLSTTYRSEPPLPTGDIIALLALGRTREDSALSQQPQQVLSESATNAILGQALDAAVSSRVQKLFGVSRIKIDPQIGEPGSSANARLTIEQQVNNNITLTYITNLSQSAQQIIQAEINLNRNVSLVVIRDQNGVLGMDVRVRQRKK